jgi:hypothetical protein
MKQMMGGAITVAAVGWLLYTGFADSQCERVYRSAAPVRATFRSKRALSRLNGAWRPTREPKKLWDNSCTDRIFLVESRLCRQ